jgi:hypothetical protein
LYLFLGLCKECSIKLNYSKTIIKSTRKNSKTSEDILKLSENRNKEFNLKNSTTDNNNDNNISIWDIENSHKIDTDINNRMDNYLKDLFQYTTTNY